MLAALGGSRQPAAGRLWRFSSSLDFSSPQSRERSGFSKDRDLILKIDG